MKSRFKGSNMKSIFSRVTLLVSFGFLATALYAYQGVFKFKRPDGQTTTVVAKQTSASDCTSRTAAVERHIQNIVRAQAKFNSMKGPVSVASFTTKCGAGNSVIINARTLVRLEWYTLRCEVRPSGMRPDASDGWIATKQEWKPLAQKK